MGTTSGKKIKWTTRAYWTHESDYWQRLYAPTSGDGSEDNLNPYILKIDGMFWLSDRHASTPREYDIGPFKCLKDAKIAAETMILLNQYPTEWNDG